MPTPVLKWCQRGVTVLETAEVLERPDREEGFADEIIDWNGSEAPAIKRRVAVVTHQKDLVGPHHEWALVGHLGAPDIVLVEGITVDENLAILDENGLAGKSDDSLDEVVAATGSNSNRFEDRANHGLGNGLNDLRFARVAKNDDVPAPRLAEVVREFVDHYPIIDLNGHFHGGRRDPERLDQKSLDDDGDDERHEKKTRQLGEEGTLLLFSRTLCYLWFLVPGLADVITGYRGT